jgi:hypothetical protein
MIDSQNIIVHQTLHGYREGHRLLQFSAKLSSESERLMLRLSDLSGSSLINGFESYLTGYPLFKDNYYAFAKTWYAEEMSRPGSVWTHTLLISFDQIKVIKDLLELKKLFVRPQQSHSFSVYKTPISLFNKQNFPESYDYKIRNQESSEKGLLKIAATALVAIYDKEQPFILFAENSTVYEELAINIWNQQWCKLRCSFKFCTGSLASRKLFEDIFDFQVSPFRSVNKIQREARSAIFFDLNLANDSKIETWAKRAIDDLFCRNESNFRVFLREYGNEAEVENERKTFVKLSRIFQFIEEGSSDTENFVSYLLKHIANEFSLPKEAINLKLDLLKDHKVQVFFPNILVSEAQILSELAKTKFYRAFDRAALDIKNRAIRFFKEDREQAKEITYQLLAHKLTPFGKDFLDGIVKVIHVQDVIDITLKDSDFIFKFFKHKPTLALDPAIWKINIDKQRILNFVIENLNPSKSELQGILTSVLESREYILLPEVALLLGGDAITIIMKWIEQSSLKINEIPNEIIEILNQQSDLVVGWLLLNQPQIETIFFVTKFINPNSLSVVNSPIELWLQLAYFNTKLQNHERISAMSFLLALGFNNPQQRGAELIEPSFQIVHDAAEENHLGMNAWRLLEHCAPSLDWFWEWDKCKRLRVALIKNFIQHQWSPQLFLNSIKRKDTWYKVIDDCWEVKQGRRFLRSIADGVSKGKFDANYYQIHTLSSFF